MSAVYVWQTSWSYLGAILQSSWILSGRSGSNFLVALRVSLAIWRVSGFLSVVFGDAWDPPGASDVKSPWGDRPPGSLHEFPGGALPALSGLKKGCLRMSQRTSGLQMLTFRRVSSPVIGK